MRKLLYLYTRARSNKALFYKKDNPPQPFPLSEF